MQREPFRELKSDKGRLSPEQEIWRDRLINAGGDWAIWTPREWQNGQIERELKGE